MSDRPGLSIFDNDNQKAAPGADDATQVMAAVAPPQQRQGPSTQRPSPATPAAQTRRAARLI